MSALTKYEQTALDFYACGDKNQQSLGQEEVEVVMLPKVQKTVAQMKNPFEHAMQWLLGELLDVKSITLAMKGYD